MDFGHGNVSFSCVFMGKVKSLDGDRLGGLDGEEGGFGANVKLARHVGRCWPPGCVVFIGFNSKSEILRRGQSGGLRRGGGGFGQVFGKRQNLRRGRRGDNERGEAPGNIFGH